MSKYSQAQTERARVEAIEKEREHRMQAWDRARAEGIREGLLMAIEAIRVEPRNRNCWEHVTMPIISRGDRHFGHAKWQAKNQP